MGTYEWENCPHCGRQLSDVRIGVASDTTIGQRVGKCPHCGGIFKTGKSEWAKKSALSKTGYFVRVAWWCLGAAIFGGIAGFIPVVIVMGMILKAPDDQMFHVGAIVAFVVGMFAVVRVFYLSRKEIKESLRRTRQNENPE